MGWLDRRDLMRWISLIVQADPHARIVLHGVSMGATEVMMTAGEPDLPGNVCTAIEECGFASVWDQFADNAVSMYHLPQRWMAVPALAGMSLFSRRKAGYGFRRASSVAQLAHATVPMLFIHGTDGAFVDPPAAGSQCRRMLQRAQGTARGPRCRSRHERQHRPGTVLADGRPIRQRCAGRMSRKA